MEYVRVTREIAQPADRVWAIVRDFAGVAEWIVGVTGCRWEGPEQAGAVRVVCLGERQAREQLLELNDAMRRIRYAVLPPHSLAAENVRSTILVEALAAGTCVTWFSEADMPTVDPAMTARIEGFFAASLARLEQLVAERGR